MKKLIAIIMIISITGYAQDTEGLVHNMIYYNDIDDNSTNLFVSSYNSYTRANHLIVFRKDQSNIAIRCRREQNDESLTSLDAPFTFLQFTTDKLETPEKPFILKYVAYRFGSENGNEYGNWTGSPNLYGKTYTAMTGNIKIIKNFFDKLKPKTVISFVIIGDDNYGSESILAPSRTYEAVEDFKKRCSNL